MGEIFSTETPSVILVPPIFHLRQRIHTHVVQNIYASYFDYSGHGTDSLCTLLNDCKAPIGTVSTHFALASSNGMGIHGGIDGTGKGNAKVFIQDNDNSLYGDIGVALGSEALCIGLAKRFLNNSGVYANIRTAKDTDVEVGGYYTNPAIDLGVSTVAGASPSVTSVWGVYKGAVTGGAQLQLNSSGIPCNWEASLVSGNATPQVSMSLRDSGKKACFGYTQRWSVVRVVVNPLEHKKVAGITSYWDFGVEVDKEIGRETPVGIRGALSFQLNKNWLFKVNMDSVSGVGFTTAFKTWNDPGITIAATTNGTGYGVSLLFQNAGFAKYQAPTRPARPLPNNWMRPLSEEQLGRENRYKEMEPGTSRVVSISTQ